MTRQNSQLKAMPRTETGKEIAGRLRVAGRLPAVIYGKDMDAIGISLDTQETEYLFQRIAVENTIVDVLIEGEEEPVQTLIREIQTLPHRPGLLHVDFLRIQKGVAVEVDIPVHLEGVPVGVKESGGMLEQVINELRVRCIPSLIPEVVAIDVTDLAVGDSVHVYDLKWDEGVEILVEAERTICSVQIPKVIEVETDEEEEELEGLEGEAELDEDEGAAGEEDDSDGDED